MVISIILQHGYIYNTVAWTEWIETNISSCTRGILYWYEHGSLLIYYTVYWEFHELTNFIQKAYIQLFCGVRLSTEGTTHSPFLLLHSKIGIDASTTSFNGCSIPYDTKPPGARRRQWCPSSSSRRSRSLAPRPRHPLLLLILASAPSLTALTSKDQLCDQLLGCWRHQAQCSATWFGHDDLGRGKGWTPLSSLFSSLLSLYSLSHCVCLVVVNRFTHRGRCSIFGATTTPRPKIEQCRLSTVSF
jgi:hypothetical protein